MFEQFMLIDAESFQHGYHRKDGCELKRGHYVVVWPEGAGELAFGDEAVFHGPYNNKREAEASQERLRLDKPREIVVPVIRPYARHNTHAGRVGFKQSWAPRQNRKPTYSPDWRLH